MTIRIKVKLRRCRRPADERADRVRAVAGPRGQPCAAGELFGHRRHRRQRSVALFAELGKVLTHPRCVNCHPAGDRPRQGDEPAAPAAGRARHGRSRPRGHALPDLSPARQLRARPRAGPPGMASRAA